VLLKLRPHAIVADDAAEQVETPLEPRPHDPSSRANSGSVLTLATHWNAPSAV